MNLAKSKNINGASKLKRKKIYRVYFLAWLVCGFLITWILLAVSADRIAFSYGFFGEFYISIADLEIFAREGKISPSFAYYADRVSKEDLAELRDVLNRHFNVSQVTANIFLNLPIGKQLVREVSSIIDSPAKVSQPALRGAIVLAAARPKGLTILNVLRLYSTKTLKLDTDKIITAVEEATKILADTERVFTALERQARISVETSNSPNINNLADLTKSGSKQWRREFLALDPNINGVVYLPVAVNKPAPLVVIAPGLNTDWQNFTYIAEHLASYGSGVAAVNFLGTNARRVNAVLNGLDTPPSGNQWVEQPKVITRLLDEIEYKSERDPIWQGKLNLQKVGVIGQSLGGYTALASAGAKVDWHHLQQECQAIKNPDRIELNPSLFWQCQSITAAPPDTNLKDNRIVAAIAVNPVTNPVFSLQGMSQLKSPLIIITGDKDLFAPALDEQIEPFTWLPEKDKYLALVKNSTHFSFIGEEDFSDLSPSQIIGSKLAIARNYLKVLSVAYFQTYLSEREEFAPYLTGGYLRSISKSALPISLLRSLDATKLKQLVEDWHCRHLTKC
ncbi:alpha/beta hydrolase [Myxosarcina sp. GI1]|uniref:alpha/beta hydrolase n=1 Tax=Myxosarcina sp. GI1 TaxID=1541065 RepID=UPI00068ACD25|nr:alpha/beta hydrolase [Myxosarcina sp. GI1]